MRQLRRKAGAAALCAVAPLLVSACGSGGSEAAGEELRVLVGAQSSYPEEQATLLKELKKRFKARTGADLVFETFADSAEETTKIQTSMVSGTGPDVYTLGTTFTPVAYATGGFETLSEDDWAAIGGRDRFIPSSLAMSGPDPEHLIGVPASVRPYGMVYNTEMFKEAGLTGPPTTWDELLTYAEKLTDPAAGEYGLALDYADGYDPWKYIWTLAEQGGGSFVSEDRTTAQLDSPEVARATQDYFELLTRHRVADPASAGWELPEAMAAFGEGKAAMLPMVTPNVMPTLDASEVKGKYAFAPLPTVPFGMDRRPPGGIEAASIVSGDNVAIASYTANRDLALEYVDLLTSKPVQTLQWELFGWIPSNQEAAQDLADSDPRLDAFLEAQDESVPTSFVGAWADVQNGVTNVVTQSLPDLAKGEYDAAKVNGLLAAADKAAQSGLDRERR